MPVLHVRNVPEPLYESLKERARSEGRSLSAEVIQILEWAVATPRRSQAQVLESLAIRRRDYSPASSGAPSVVAMIREDRQR